MAKTVESHSFLNVKQKFVSESFLRIRLWESTLFTENGWH